MSVEEDYDFSYAQMQLERSNSQLRRLVKNFYLRNLLKDVQGPSIDFGCGAGQVLELLPPDSVGLEVNMHLVEALQRKKLNVVLYKPDEDRLSFGFLPEGHFQTFVMSHVLEHFEDAQKGLKTILESCRRLKVKRVIIVVPTKKGYEFDDTHRTFIDLEFFNDHALTSYAGYKISSASYFPINSVNVGEYMTFHELKVVFDTL